MKTRRIAFYLFIFSIVSVIIYLIVGQIYLNKEIKIAQKDYYTLQEGWIYVAPDGSMLPINEDTIMTPTRYDEAGSSFEARLTNTIPNVNIFGKSFVMWNREWNTKIYIDGKLRLDFPQENYSFHHDFVASQYIWVRLFPEDIGKQVDVIIDTNSPRDFLLTDFYLATDMGIFEIGLMPYVFEVLMSIFLIIISFLCILVASIIQKNYEKEVSIKYFCWGTIVFSCWIMMNTAARQFIFHNITTVRNCTFLFICLIPPPFYMYMNRVQNRRYQMFYNVEYLISMILFTGTMVLNICNIVTVKQMSRIIQLSCIQGGSLIIILAFYDIVVKKIREYIWVGVGMVVLVSFSTVHVLIYMLSSKPYFDTKLIQIGLGICLMMAAYSLVRMVGRLQSEKRAAVYASKAKSDFLANMSHEIRTPINAVLGMDELILRESHETETIEYANQIKTAGKTLLSLINDILDFSKIESGKMDIVETEYDFGMMVMSLYEMTKERAEKKNLKLELYVDQDIPAKLYGDDVRIKQVITNTLTNAVKYTHEGSVSLTIRQERIDQEYVKLSVAVKDTGIGIKDEDKDKLFNAFQRIEEERNRNIEGTGLGLQITQKLLHLMNSTMVVESEYGKGSCFSFDLVQKIVEDTPVGDIKAHYDRMNQNSSDYRELFVAPDLQILVVDDNKVNLAVFKGLLKKTKIQITTALSGKECLELCKNNQYKMIFLDHMMPEMDGIETFHIFKKMEENKSKDAKVIMLTANAIEGAKEKYLAEGFDAFLEKPINGTKLEEMIRDFWIADSKEQ